MPALTAFVVIWVTFGIVLLFYHVVPYFGFAILLQFGASLFLFALMLSSRLLLARDRFQLLDIVPAANAYSDIAESYTKCAAKANRLPVRGLDLLQLATSLVLIAAVLAFFSSAAMARQIGCRSFLLQLHHRLFGFAGLVLQSLLLRTDCFFLHVEEHDKKSQSFYKRVAEESLEPYVSSGIGILPMESRVGDTHNIVLDFDFSDNFKEFCAKPAFNQHLEAELLAAGLQTRRGETSPTSPSSPLPATIWNCCFSAAGEHRIN